MTKQLGKSRLTIRIWRKHTKNIFFQKEGVGIPAFFYGGCKNLQTRK